MEIIDAEERRMWREHCAVVQLPMRQFLDIQNSLLFEQLELVAESSWLSAFPKARPKSIEEFRRVAPLSRWQDYTALSQHHSPNGRVGDLHCWVQTSWCHGSWKQVPWARRFFDAQCRHIIAALMMSVAHFEGDVRLNKDFRVLPVLPDTPFASAWIAMGVAQRNVVSSRLAPQPGDADLSMSQQLQAGLRRSLKSNVDCVVGMTSTLLLARREFQRMVANTNFRRLRSQAGTRAAMRWRLEKVRRLGRGKPWEPKSLLAPKSVITWGADTTFLTPTIEAQWGAPVFQLYASSEAGIIAMQDWRRKALVPVPTSVFLEFLPAGAPPDNEAPVLLDQLEEGKLYEPVITSFYGMPFARLRQGDFLQVVGHNERGVPEFQFHSRADDIIDLGSIARIDGATLAEALALVDVKDGEWLARKEYVDGQPVMCLYFETVPENAEELRRRLHRALGKVDHHYREASYTLGYPLLRISPLKKETLGRPEGAMGPEKGAQAPSFAAKGNI